MKTCHVCKAVCEENAELCHICGADLTAYEEETANEDNREIKNPVLVASIEDVVSAEIFKDILTDNGILFSCGEKEEDGIKVVFGGNFVSEDIYVDDNDFETAEKLYSDFLKSEPQFEGEYFVEEESADDAESSDTEE